MPTLTPSCRSAGVLAASAGAGLAASAARMRTWRMADPSINSRGRRHLIRGLRLVDPADARPTPEERHAFGQIRPAVALDVVQHVIGDRLDFVGRQEAPGFGDM